MDYHYSKGQIGKDDRVIYFDMDGTIANLYSVPNWEPMLRAFDPTPYAQAEVMFDPHCNHGTQYHLKRLREEYGWKVGVLSWLARDSNDEYDSKVIDAKLCWLSANGFPDLDDIWIVPYGTPKYELVEPEAALLVDDEGDNRMHWDASGPFRRSFPAFELNDTLANTHRAYLEGLNWYDDTHEGTPCSLEEICECMHDRFIAGVAVPGLRQLEIVRGPNGKPGIKFVSDRGWRFPYDKVVEVADENNVSEAECIQMHAVAHLLWIV